MPSTAATARRHPRCIRQNATTVAAIAPHSTTISTAASPYAPAAKKIGVQAALSTNCTTYGTSGQDAPTRSHTSHPASATVT